MKDRFTLREKLADFFFDLAIKADQNRVYDIINEMGFIYEEDAMSYIQENYR